MQSQSDDMPYWLATMRMPDIGPAKIRRWLEYFHDIKNLFSTSEEELKSCGLNAKDIHTLKNPDWNVVTEDIKWRDKPNCHLISMSHAAYPVSLRQLSDAPLVLYVRGNLSILSQPQIAIVGSRNPTPAGKELAEQFAYRLSQAGLIVTSGLALGIDAASHQGALAAKAPTIAVNGTGLNHIYPRSNTKLADQIVRDGALVSEFLPDTGAVSYNFPRRNRLISGLCVGVLVVEAAVRSGSLITARFAAEQGREVFAIPGSIHNPLARGCHHLIQQGAKLVEKADDILEELGALIQTLPTTISQTQGAVEEKHQALLDKIGYESTALDTIIQRSGLTVGQVSSMLVSLELGGYVQIVAGGYARLA